MGAQEKEIDLIVVAGQLWRARRFILKVAGVFLFVGALFALGKSTSYVAGSVMVTQGGAQSSRAAGLAAMAGINMGSQQTGELTPESYPLIVRSIPFQKELMQTELTFAGHGKVKVIDYFTDKKYHNFSLVGALYKYTLGLPGVVMGAFRGRPAAAEMPVSADGLERLSPREEACRKALSQAVWMVIDNKKGEITLSARMPEALAAAQLADASQKLLQKYITAFKIQKVSQTLEFVEERCEEARVEFERAQNALAAFRDANRNVVTQTAMVRGERLQNEYDLAFGIYSNLASQREHARIRLKEETPTFTVVEPVTIPVRPAPTGRSTMLAIFVLLGIVVGCVWVLVRQWLANQRPDAA